MLKLLATQNGVSAPFCANQADALPIAIKSNRRPCFQHVFVLRKLIYAFIKARYQIKIKLIPHLFIILYT